MFWSCNFYAISFILACSSISSLAAASSAQSDRLALVALKYQITNDPHGALSSWNDSLHYCHWNGVRCGHRHRDRVTVLDLDSQKLEGTLSPHIGNLSFLRTINLTKNNFHGPIPQEIGHLFRLQVLSLNDNSFEGRIPANLTSCSNLEMIGLANNKLVGGIPIELTSLSKLAYLHLDKNHELKGGIPSSLGNLSSLVELDLAYTDLTGRIPDDLCRMQSIENLQFGSNNLSGIVPSCLYNLSQVTVFVISNNHLDGSLPMDIGLTLPNLQVLYVGRNNFGGVIPLSLSNASKLERVSLSTNQFCGQVPRDLGRLEHLLVLALDSNPLGSQSGYDFDFLTSLTNCSNLQILQIGDNSLRGPVPNSIANLSTQMSLLIFGPNQMYGGIPEGIQNLINLERLYIGYTYLTDQIPKAIGMFPKMQILSFPRNRLSGQIPDSLGNLTMLLILDLQGNGLHGTVPRSLGNCQKLYYLELSDNRLRGTIPKQVIHLSSLALLLNLSNNALSGSLPLEVGNLTSLEKLDISWNLFSGDIPDTLGNCLTLEYLNMAGNIFKGNIPSSLNSLRGVKGLNLSHNVLSGEIPKYLVNLTSLSYLDLSYNELEGPVPKDGLFANASVISVRGNAKLCGGIAKLKLSPCPIKKKGNSFSHKKVIAIVIAVFSFFIFLCFFLVLYQRRKGKENSPVQPSLNHQFPRISYAELIKATNSFSSDNLIGVGSYGSVYKGLFDQVNKTFAVKVLNLQQRGASKSFLSECNALRNLRHRNLLKIITSCSSVDFQGNDFKALVFEFMPNGSLEDWLHPKREEQCEPRNLNFLQRLNVAIDVASALEYLHCHCEPAIVHCDLKPSNILLDDDMTAHVADFGLARIFSVNAIQSDGSSLAVKGSIGYVAPEYGMGGEVSIQGDTYSYGVLLLELLTGKRPTHNMFQDGQNLCSFAKTAWPEQVMNVVDPTMLLESNDEGVEIANHSDRQVRVQNCLLSAIKLGIACSTESPFERKNMGEVVAELHHIRDHHQGVRIHLE